MNLEIKTYKTKESEEYKEKQEIRNKAIEYKSELYLEKWLKEIKIKQKEGKDLFYFIEDVFSEEGDSFSDDKDRMDSESKKLALTKLIKREGYKVRKDFTHFCPSTGYPIYSEYRVELFDEDFRSNVLEFVSERKGFIQTNFKTLKRFFIKIKTIDVNPEETLFFKLKFINIKKDYFDGPIRSVVFEVVDEKEVHDKEYIELGV